MIMGPDLELKEKLRVEMEVRVDREKGSVLHGQEDMIMAPCACNLEDNSFLSESLYQDQVQLLEQHEDMEVNIIDCSAPFEKAQGESVSEDATESLSSFGDTVSENDNGLGDAEVESQFCSGPAPTSILDECKTPIRMRKKRLTDHWRRFVRPIMWRCKWIELQLKEFQTQALKYEKELAENERQKQFNFETFLAGDFPAKSLPFSSHREQQKVMKRKKRKRFEQSTDLASYMSQHNIFSYYEEKKSAAGGTSLEDDCGNQGEKGNGNHDLGFRDSWAPLGSEGGDNIEEQMLRKIEMLQMQICKLRGRINKVVGEIPRKFSSVNILSLPAPLDALNSSDPKHCSPTQNGASSYGEVTPLPSVFGSIGLPQAGDLCENSEKQIQDFRNVGFHLKGEPAAIMEKKALQALEADMPTETLMARPRYGGKSLPKSRSKVTPKSRSKVTVTKRKRGRRRTVVGKRRKRS